MAGFSYGYGLSLTRRRSALLAGVVIPPAQPSEPPVTPPANTTGIFGFSKPATAPTTFPGALLELNEIDATDSLRWTRQNNDAALFVTPGNIGSNGSNASSRFIGYIDEKEIAVGERLAILPKIETVNGNIGISSNASGSNSTTTNNRLGWKQGTLTATSAVFPRVGFFFPAGVSGSVSKLQAYNLTKLLAQKWFIVFTVGQSNWVGSTAIADPNIDTPVEGCVVFPGATNSYVGAQSGSPMIAVDPMNHQTLNGSSSAYGGGPGGSFCRELRKLIPADYTIVYVTTNYNGEGFKANGLWNKNNTSRSPIAYTNFWTRTREVWSQAPAGSVMGGMVFCGGESDLGAGNEVEWASTVTGVPALINEVRAEPNWGQVPVVFAEIGMAHTDPNVISMTALQRKLTTGSGDALEFPRCKFVPRPTDYKLHTDDTHYVQETHRQRGIDVARGLASIIYPNA